MSTGFVIPPSSLALSFSRIVGFDEEDPENALTLFVLQKRAEEESSIGRIHVAVVPFALRLVPLRGIVVVMRAADEAQGRGEGGGQEKGFQGVVEVDHAMGRE